MDARRWTHTLCFIFIMINWSPSNSHPEMSHHIQFTSFYHLELILITYVSLANNPIKNKNTNKLYHDSFGLFCDDIAPNSSTPNDRSTWRPRRWRLKDDLASEFSCLNGLLFHIKKKINRIPNAIAWAHCCSAPLTFHDSPVYFYRFTLVEWLWN